jgi:iron complex transport system ATP-binding protein
MRERLEATDLQFSFDRRRAVAGVSLSVSEGEFVGLIGPNGSGKSTLLRLLLGTLKPEQGGVRLGGVPISRLSRREVAQKIAFVPQSTQFDFPFPVREIVAMGRTPHLGRFRPLTAGDSAIVAEAMVATRIDSFAHRQVTELSGGERQRVHVARALAQSTPFIVLDEPTSSLDLAHQLNVLGLMAKQAESGRGVIAAVHDLTLAARYCTAL